MDFNPSDPNTVGMELELQLLDANTLDLVDGILPLMEFFPNSQYIKPEFVQNTVEITSRVCTSCEQISDHLSQLTREVQ